MNLWISSCTALLSVVCVRNVHLGWFAYVCQRRNSQRMDVRPEKGRATDDSTGRDLWQNRPVETSWTEGSSSPTPSRSVAKSVSVGSLRRLVVFPESPASRTNHPAVPSVCGAGVLEHDRARASAGWVKARQRSEQPGPQRA